MIGERPGEEGGGGEGEIIVEAARGNVILEQVVSEQFSVDVTRCDKVGRGVAGDEDVQHGWRMLAVMSLIVRAIGHRAGGMTGVAVACLGSPSTGRASKATGMAFSGVRGRVGNGDIGSCLSRSHRKGRGRRRS